MTEKPAIRAVLTIALVMWRVVVLRMRTDHLHEQLRELERRTEAGHLADLIHLHLAHNPADVDKVRERIRTMTAAKEA